MDLQAHINDIVTVAESLKLAPGANTKWLNKTIARLEEAALFAGQATGKTTTTAATCTCPTGAIANDCPIHKSLVTN